MRTLSTKSRRLNPLLFCTLLALAPWAWTAELREDAPDSYVVQPGDTLWSIAGRFLHDPWRWREVWRGSDLGNPNLIYPGDVLRLSRVDGRPSIGVERGGESAAGHQGGLRVVRLSPRVRTTSLREAVPTIPIASIGPFLTQPYVTDEDDLRRAPYVVGFAEEHIVAGIGDSFYVRRIDNADITRFQVLRPGEALRDPDSNEILGYQAVFVANADLERVGDPAKLQVVRAEREIAIGDRVLPAALEESLSNFFPTPAPSGLRGRILAVLNGVSQIGLFDVVVLNKGTSDGVEVGHVFEVYQGGTTERDQVRKGGFNDNWREQGPLSTEFWLGSDVKIQGWRHDQPSANEPFPPTVDIRRPRSTFITPFERSGVLMVFRTFDRVSFGLILEATRSLHITDRVSPPPY